MGQTYQFECSVECAVGREFAWRFWSDVRNWSFDSDIESVELHGPFVSGTRGVTISRSSGRIEWVLRDVRVGESAVMEIASHGVVAWFHLSFQESDRGTRITQRVSIEGENATGLGQMLEQGIPEGMKKLAEKMSEAAAKSV
jgi:hypothetical protein